jgi:hypothetical protein
MPAAVTARRWLLLGLLLHVFLQLLPAAERVGSASHGRDYASYHYAVHVAASGGDPYDTASLDAAARAERTRKTVQPYFYPPPFLLGLSWAVPLPLAMAYRAMLLLNELLLGAVLWLCLRRFHLPAWGAAALLALYTPIPDNAWMGQANFLALLPALGGLALLRGRERQPPSLREELLGGVLIGVAGMAKMSPALYLLAAAMGGRWRAVGAAALTAVGLSLLTLPLVDLSTQLRFYTEVLPGFAKGSYHGLTVPIGLGSNHSIPNLWHRLWPGTATALSAPARLASSLGTLALLALWSARARQLRRREGASEAPLSPALLGALGVILVITPTYTYEHHLVFLIPAIGAAMGAVASLGDLRARRRAGAALLLCFALLACPLGWVSGLAGSLPKALGVLVREGKTLGALGLLALLLALAGMRPPLAEAPAAR